MTRQFDLGDVAASDAFLDALSRGQDPSAGTDPLAGVLLALKDDVERPMPETPSVTTAPDVAPRRRMSPWVSGLIGAAAASAAIVGGGALFYNPGAAPGDETTMVELATTLDELEVASENGDQEAAKGLLEQARHLVAEMKREQRSGGSTGVPASSAAARTVTVTTTASSVPQAPSPAPANPAPEQSPSADAPATKPAPEQTSRTPVSESKSSSATSSPSAVEQPSPQVSSAAANPARPSPDQAPSRQDAEDQPAAPAASMTQVQDVPTPVAADTSSR